MINIKVTTEEGKINRSKVSGEIGGEDKVLSHELCTFFEAVDKIRPEAFEHALDMFLTEKLKEVEGDDEE